MNPDLVYMIVCLALLAGAVVGLGRQRLLIRTLRSSLSRAEAKTTAILEAAVDGVITIDEHGTIRSFNRAAEKIFGYSPEAVIGRNVKMLMPEPYHSEHDRYLTNYKTTERPKIIGIGREVSGRRQDGTVFPMDLAVGESRLGGRRLFAGIVRDVTEKKKTEQQLRHSEESFRLLIDNVRDYAIIRLDTEGRIASWNAGAERLYGWTASEVVGRPHTMFHLPEAAEEGRLTLLHVREHGRFEGEGWRNRKDGSRFQAHTVITPLWDVGGRMQGYVRITQDITDRKRFEEVLRRAKEDAEQAKEDAERANIAKSKFLAAASHDLRQPIQAMAFFTTALASEVRTPSAQPLLHDLKESLAGVNVLLDSLMDVSRLDAGIVQPRLTNFSLATLLNRLRSEFSPLAGDKRLTLRVRPTTAIVRSDPTLLERILQNLLSNAIRYTDRGGILIGVRVRGQTLRIEVWDTGIGIPKDRLDDIFQEFYQIGNEERNRTQGLGLGLAIVQRLSLLLSHRVEVRSVQGRGSVFRIDVPLIGFNSQKVTSRPPLSSPTPSGGHKGVVIIIDDEAIILRGLKVVLEGWGYRVLIAASEAEAMERLAEYDKAPDIIIADYRLRAGKTGIQAIRHIREHFGNRPIPSVVITGDSAPERLREAEASGYHLMHKPVNPPQLQAVLEDYRMVG